MEVSNYPPPIPGTASSKAILGENFIYKSLSIQPIISQLLIREMRNENAFAYAYVPTNNMFINTHIDNVIKQYNANINITFFIDMLSPSADEVSNYNLNVLKNILPITLSAQGDYQFYYTHVNSIIDSSYMSPYPYFIALSDVVIFISADCDEIMLNYEEEVVNSILKHCEGMLQNYKKLMDYERNVPNIVETIVKNQNNNTTHLCIEYEPCLSLYFTKEMVDSVTSKDIPMRNELLSLLYVRLGQLKKINKSIQIFNKNSLMEFAKTGWVMEFPKEYSRPLDKEERLYILNSLLKNAKSPNHCIQAINPINLDITDCLSLIVQNENNMQFTIWNDRKMELSYYSITQHSICKHFYEFINDIIDTDYLYNQETSIQFIIEAIEYVKSL